jgi:hypothetical protein
MMLHGRYPEYDAFGPWIYLIDERHTLPPLFHPYGEALGESLMCFKIPRNIERRDAHPHMNLYDAVIAVFEDRILYLERKERIHGIDGTEEYTAETLIPMDMVKSVTMYTCLLRGELTLHTRSRDILIPFNTVSEDTILNTVRLIRSLIVRGDGPVSLDLPAREYSLTTMEHGFVNMIKGICARDESLRPAAYQRDLTYRIPRSFSWAPMNSLGLKERLLSTFAVLGNAGELVVVHRRFYPGRASSECYAYTYHFIPAASLERVIRCPTDGPYPGLMLDTGSRAPVFPVDPENPEIRALEKALERLGPS